MLCGAEFWMQVFEWIDLATELSNLQIKQKSKLI